MEKIKKMKKIVIGALLGVGLLGFPFVSMAQGTPDTKSPCDYLTTDEVGSVLGHAGIVQNSPVPKTCSYFDSQTQTMVSLVIITTHLTSAQVDAIYQPLLQQFKPIDGIGDKAAEFERTPATGVYFFKNGTYGEIMTTLDQDHSKTEALAKIVVSKL